MEFSEFDFKSIKLIGKINGFVPIYTILLLKDGN